MTPVLLCGLALIAYGWAAARYTRRFPRRAFGASILSFVSGLLVIAAVLSPPFDRLADDSFCWHMLQHLALTLVAPPLLLLGAPGTLIAASAPAPIARRIGRALHGPFGRILGNASAAWLAFVGVLWLTHLSPLYEAALEDERVHAAEHALYLMSAIWFWTPVASKGVGPIPLPFPARMLYLFVAVPPCAFLGLAIYDAPMPLYPHYLAGKMLTQVMNDQRAGGELMWLGGGLLLFAAFLLTAWRWAEHERPTRRTA